MIRTSTIMKQYLAAAFLIVIGLIAYGCGDSGSASDPAELGSLSVSDGELQPPFNPATTNYTVRLFSDVSSTTITASPRVAGDTIRFDNQQTTSQTITIASPGNTKSVTIVVTETGAGGTSKSYNVTVQRDQEDTSLQDLSVSRGTLAPSFEKESTSYTVNNVPAALTTLTISAIKSNLNTVMQIGSVTVPAGVVSGQATIDLGPSGTPPPVFIVITPLIGTARTITININRDAPSNNNFLDSLAIEPGRLTFRRTRFTYNVNVGSGVETVRVTAAPQDSTASIAFLVDGTVRDARSIPLTAPGSTTKITVRVTAQNGQSRDYEINVRRAALNGNTNLRSLTVSPGNLTFDPADQDYTVNLLSNVTSVTITAAPQDSTARVTINGQPSPADISLGAPGPETRITTPITVTAQNNDTKRYEVTFIRAALGGNNNLQSLAVSQPGLSPSFRADRTVYRLNVENNIDSITVTASPQVTSSSMSMKVNNGVPINLTAGQASPSISLAPGPSDTEIEIIVKAQNQSEKPYVITVTRAAASSNNNLSALRVNGSSVPGFAQGTLDYTVNVANSVNAVTISATKADPNAVMLVGSVTVPAGTATGETTVPVSATPLSIAVTAQSGGAPKTYTVTVRQGPPAPTVAPDLITEDDSCSPPTPTDPGECATGTSKEDNVTDVTTPRFSIPPPGSGETATLYINGRKDESSSTTGNLLTPSTPLPDGVYDITYTITNAVGESGPSPIMMTPPPQLQKLWINTTVP